MSFGSNITAQCNWIPAGVQELHQDSALMPLMVGQQQLGNLSSHTISHNGSTHHPKPLPQCCKNGMLYHGGDVTTLKKKTE